MILGIPDASFFCYDINISNDISGTIVYNHFKCIGREMITMNNENKTSLVDYMRDIPDPRAPYNQRHSFIDIIMIAVLAILCGMDTWDEIEDWALSQQDWLRTFLELPNGIPSHDTINRVFQMIEPEKFHTAFLEWSQSLFGQIEGVVAIDGKTVRRSKDSKNRKRPIHVVSAWAVENNLVLGQNKVDEKTNEIKAIPELLEILCLKGCIVTIDAMGTQKEIATKILEREADYILQVKGNQATLLEDISLYFEKEVFLENKAELRKAERYFKEQNGEHGRLETREYYVENDISWMKEYQTEWKGLKGIGACISTVEKNGQKSRTVTYAIYSRQDMNAEEYGKSKRSHWQIENGLHWVLDIGFREDESRIRAGNAAENVNVLRHICMNLLKQEKSCKMGIAAKRKKCSYDASYRLKVLNGVAGIR